MFELERAEGGERALLLQPLLSVQRGSADGPSTPVRDPDEDLAEFGELARSAGAEAVQTVSAPVRRPDPATLVGKGKLEELRAAVENDEIELVIVNHELSPGQERNLEKALRCRVVDRIGLILDIFAQRASTAEGKLQVELAQLRHMSTRLVRGWTHLERQKGGIGLRGPGETQLETDRRLLGERIKLIRERLERVQVHRELGRRARDRTSTPLVSLVGYTNAGKSTLFNALTGASVLAEDKLFATLDPTVRRIELPGPVPVVVADTVGFIRDLPHELVAAFRATLEETRRAALLLHVVDATDNDIDEKRAQVNAVLEAVGAHEIPQLEVVNKVDSLDPVSVVDALPGQRGGTSGGVVERDAQGLPARVRVSALRGDGLDQLREAVAERFAGALIESEVRLPLDEGRLRARLHELKSVVSERVDEEAWQMVLSLRPASYERLCSEFELQRFRVEDAARGSQSAKTLAASESANYDGRLTEAEDVA